MTIFAPEAAVPRDDGVPGVALDVLCGGIAQTTGFGITNVAVDDHTLFPIGSTTTTVTGTAAMRLVEAGRLDLDAPLRSYLPELRLRDEDVATAWICLSNRLARRER